MLRCCWSKTWFLLMFLQITLIFVLQCHWLNVLFLDGFFSHISISSEVLQQHLFVNQGNIASTQYNNCRTSCSSCCLSKNTIYTAKSWFLLWEENTQNEHAIAHFECFFTCHYSKTVWLAENLNERKITHYEKIFSHIKQKFSHFEKGLGNVLKENIFCLTEIIIILTEIHRIKTKPKNNHQNILTI